MQHKSILSGYNFPTRSVASCKAQESLCQGHSERSCCRFVGSHPRGVGGFARRKLGNNSTTHEIGTSGALPNVGHFQNGALLTFRVWVLVKIPTARSTKNMGQTKDTREEQERREEVQNLRIKR